MPHSHAAATPDARGPRFEDFAGRSPDAETAADLGMWRWDLGSGRVELSERLQSILGLRSNRLTGTLEDGPERRLTHITGEIRAMISVKDLDHRYRLVNDEVARLAGVPVEQLIGRTATEMFPIIGSSIDALASQALTTLETVHSDVDIVVRGEPRTFHLIAFPLCDHTGSPVEICSITTDVTDARRLEAEARLRGHATRLIGSALREDRLVAMRQPLVDISNGRTVSEELLVRLSLPDDGGLMQPCAFLPIAERFRLVAGIDRWMLDRALAIAASRQVQVNLSAVTLSDRGAREEMIATLEQAPEAARCIVFEITETAAAEHLDDAAEFAHALSAIGCGLALDDFGVGFGSFTYLRRLPLRYLKIDRSFVAGLTTSAQDRKVVASIIGVARQFELETIAEGVEDPETLDVLGELGADVAQGFYLGRPGPLI